MNIAPIQFKPHWNVAVPCLYVETDKASLDGINKNIDDNTMPVAVGYVNL